jgi:hypothetical protein
VIPLIVGFLLFVALAVAGDLLSEEVRGWLDLVPHGLLRLAATRLDKSQRETIYRDEWIPELEYALKGKDARPVTRLIVGITYAVGVNFAAREVARRVERMPETPQTFAHAGVAEVRAGSPHVPWSAGPPHFQPVDGRGIWMSTGKADMLRRQSDAELGKMIRSRTGTRQFSPPWPPQDDDGPDRDLRCQA